MFFLRRPTDERIARLLAGWRDLPLNYTSLDGYTVDHHRVALGAGEAVWTRACAAIDTWQTFPASFTEVYPRRAMPEAGLVVGVLIRHLGFWSLNPSRIIERIREPHRYGFRYATLTPHAESGAERFLVERDPASGEVWYDLCAQSRPGHPLAWLGYPVARALQRRFARESLESMKALH